MNTNDTLQMDVLDILFANRNKTYGAYQLRRDYNQRLSIAIAVMLSICLSFTLFYSLQKKQLVTGVPIKVIEGINLIELVKEKPAVPPLTVKPLHIEQHVATTQFSTPILVEKVTTPPPTVMEVDNVRIDLKTTTGTDVDYPMPPVEQGTGTVQSLIKQEPYDGVFTVVQQEARFPGGSEEWRKFLQRNLRSELPSDNGAAAGSYTVMVSFLVNKDGNISEVKAENDPGYGTAIEAVRVIQRGPTWIPALQNGRSVIYRQRQAITFVVNQE